MPTLLLSQKIYSEEDKEFSDILNTVDIHRIKPVTPLHSQSILNKYKEGSLVLNSVKTNTKEVRKKTMQEIIQESFFHGASWLGPNFIA